MNKIGEWVNIKNFLPTPDKLVLLRMEEEHHYIIARLYSYDYTTNNVIFIPERDGGGCTIDSRDVTHWCNIKLDNVED